MIWRGVAFEPDTSAAAALHPASATRDRPVRRTVRRSDGALYECFEQPVRISDAKGSVGGSKGNGTYTPPKD